MKSNITAVSTPSSIFKGVTVGEAFAERINPRKFNFSPQLAALVGAIIGHDYGVRDRKGGRLTSLHITSDGFVIAGSTAHGSGAFIGSADDLNHNLADFRSCLSAGDAGEFDALYNNRVTDYRR